MNFFSITRLRTITAGSLIILIISLFAIRAQHRENMQKEGIRSGATLEFAKARQSESAVRASLGAGLTHDSKAAPLDDAYAKAMVTIRDQAMPHLVRVLTVNVGSRQLDAKGIKINDLSEKTADGSALRKIRIRMKGRYESLTGLQEYFDLIKRSPAIIRTLEIAKDQFDIEILVLGT